MTETDQPAGVVGAIEARILALLAAGLGTSWRIEPFPAEPEAFDLASAAHIALVHYTGSRYDRPEGLGGGGQVRRPVFAVHLYLRDLRGEGGSYRAIEDVRLALEGAPAVPGAGGVGLEITRDELVEQSGGVWHWLVEVRALVRAVPRPAPPRVTTFAGAGRLP